MKHIEAHVVNTAQDEQLLSLVDMPAPDMESCAHGGEGLWSPTRFVPYVIVLDDRGHHYLCLECAKPLTSPGY